MEGEVTSELDGPTDTTDNGDGGSKRKRSRKGKGLVVL